MRSCALVFCLFLLSIPFLPAAAHAADQATVTTHAGDVYFGRVARDADVVRLERTDGSVVTFPADAVASVVPVADGASLAAAPGVAAAPVVVPTFARPVVRATEPSPPPPPVPTTFVRTAAPRVVDVDRSVLAAAASGAAKGSCEPDPCAESPWAFRGGLALGLGAGNSDFFDVRVDAEVERKPTPWGFRASLTYVYGERDDDVSANNWRGLARGERAFGRNYVFGQVLYERDVLADLVYRWTLTVGVGRTFVDTKAHTFKGEVGAGVTIEKRDRLEQTSDPSGWLGLDYTYRWSETCRFRATYDFRPNFGDFDLSASTLELKYYAPCFKWANIVVGLRLDHVIDPPEDDIESLDLLFTVGLSFER